MTAKKKFFFAIVTAFAAIAIAVVFCDAGLYLLASKPIFSKKFGTPVRNLARDVYWSSLRNVIQYEPDMSAWNAETFYLLKSGRFHFKNFEFDTEYSVNSKGFRDDEASLQDPEVIVLGDSYAMGWGVNQNETFSAVLEKLTGKKVLNTGVSSFATAVEAHLLEELDRSHLKTLVIQYCANDSEPNDEFVKNGFVLGDRSQEKYKKAQGEYFKQRRYLPGSLTFRFVKDKLRSLIKSKVPPLVSRELEARNFLKIMDHSLKNFKEPLKIVLFENYLLDKVDDTFVQAVAKELKQGDYHPSLKTMKLLDLSSTLIAEDYFVVDEHLNANGHRAIADKLAEWMSAL